MAIYDVGSNTLYEEIEAQAVCDGATACLHICEMVRVWQVCLEVYLVIEMEDNAIIPASVELVGDFRPYLQLLYLGDLRWQLRRQHLPCFYLLFCDSRLELDKDYVVDGHVHRCLEL